MLILLCFEVEFNPRSNFSQPSSGIALAYQSFCSRRIVDRLYCNWIAEKIWTGRLLCQLNYLSIDSGFSNKICYSDPVVFNSICHRTRAKRLVGGKKFGRVGQSFSQSWPFFRDCKHDSDTIILNPKTNLIEFELHYIARYCVRWR